MYWHTQTILERKRLLPLSEEYASVLHVYSNKNAIKFNYTHSKLKVSVSQPIQIRLKVEPTSHSSYKVWILSENCLLGVGIINEQRW